MNTNTKKLKGMTRIISLVLIQTFLAMNFAWCGITEMSFAQFQASSSTLAPQITLDKDSVKTLFTRSLVDITQEEVTASSELQVGQPQTAGKSAINTLGTVLSGAFTILVAWSSVVDAAMLNANAILMQNISLSSLSPLLIIPVVIGMVAMFGLLKKKASAYLEIFRKHINGNSGKVLADLSKNEEVYDAFDKALNKFFAEQYKRELNDQEIKFFGALWLALGELDDSELIAFTYFSFEQIEELLQNLDRQQIRQFAKLFIEGLPRVQKFFKDPERFNRKPTREEIQHFVPIWRALGQIDAQEIKLFARLSLEEAKDLFQNLNRREIKQFAQYFDNIIIKLPHKVKEYAVNKRWAQGNEQRMALNRDEKSGTTDIRTVLELAKEAALSAGGLTEEAQKYFSKQTDRIKFIKLVELGIITTTRSGLYVVNKAWYFGQSKDDARIHEIATDPSTQALSADEAYKAAKKKIEEQGLVWDDKLEEFIPSKVKFVAKQQAVKSDPVSTQDKAVQPIPKAKDLAGQAKLTYDALKDRLTSLKNNSSMNEIVDGMWPFLNNLGQYYDFEMDETGERIIRASGIARLRRDIPCIVIQDLHALSDQLADILLTEVNGISLLRLLAEGKLQIVLLGDIMHSEDKELMDKVKDEFWALNSNAEVKQLDFAVYIEDLIKAEGKKPAGLKNMFEEATRSLKAAAMVMLLKQNFKDNVVVLKGNHDNIKNENDAKLPGFDTKEGYGNMYFNKYITFPGDGEAYKAFYKAVFGQEFIDAYGIWDNVMEIAATMEPVVFTHGPSWKKLTFEQVAKRDAEAVRGLIGYQMFRIQDRPENHKLQVNDFLRMMSEAEELEGEFTLNVHGHRHRVKFDEKNNRFVLNQIGKLTGTAFLPDEKYDGETAEKNIFTADNMVRILEKLSAWAAVAEKQSADIEETQFREAAEAPAQQPSGEIRHLPTEGVSAESEYYFDYTEPVRFILGEGENAYSLLLEKKGNAFHISAKGIQGIAFNDTEQMLINVGTKKGFNNILFPEEAEGIEAMHASFEIIGDRITIVYSHGETAIRYAATSEQKADIQDRKVLSSKPVIIHRTSHPLDFTGDFRIKLGVIYGDGTPIKTPYIMTVKNVAGNFEITGEAIGTITVREDEEREITYGRASKDKDIRTPSSLDDPEFAKYDVVSNNHGKIVFSGNGRIEIFDSSSNKTELEWISAEPKKAPVFTAAFIKSLFENAVGKGIEGRTALSKELDLRIKQNSEAVEEAIEDILKTDGNEEKRKIAAAEVQRLAESGKLSAEALSKLLEVFNAQPEFGNLTKKAVVDRLGSSETTSPLGLTNLGRLQELRYNRYLIEQAI